MQKYIRLIGGFLKVTLLKTASSAAPSDSAVSEDAGIKLNPGFSGGR
jgi:hypothetical protein